jgi:hypothetical protein
MKFDNKRFNNIRGVRVPADFPIKKGCLVSYLESLGVDFFKSYNNGSLLLKVKPGFEYKLVKGVNSLVYERLLNKNSENMYPKYSFCKDVNLVCAELSNPEVYDERLIVKSGPARAYVIIRGNNIVYAMNFELLKGSGIHGEYFYDNLKSNLEGNSFWKENRELLKHQVGIKLGGFGVSAVDFVKEFIRVFDKGFIGDAGKLEGLKFIGLEDYEKYFF